MKEYHKIQTIFKRDIKTKHKTLLEGQYSIPEFEYLKDNQWSLSEKINGTNIRVMYDGDNITFGGKTDNAQIPAMLLNKLNETFLPLKDKLDDIIECERDALTINPICLYGEGYGPKIQKGGGNYGPEQDFILFDIKIGHWWLMREDVEDIAARLGIKVVPIIGEGTLEDMINMAKAGIKSTFGDFEAEGIVARPKVELLARSGKRIIAKIKCKDFRG